MKRIIKCSLFVSVLLMHFLCGCSDMLSQFGLKTHVYVLANNGVHVSGDNGNSWEKIRDNSDMIADNTGRIFARNGSVYAAGGKPGGIGNQHSGKGIGHMDDNHDRGRAFSLDPDRSFCG